MMIIGFEMRITPTVMEQNMRKIPKAIIIILIIVVIIFLSNLVFVVIENNLHKNMEFTSEKWSEL